MVGTDRFNDQRSRTAGSVEVASEVTGDVRRRFHGDDPAARIQPMVKQGRETVIRSHIDEEGRPKPANDLTLERRNHFAQIGPVEILAATGIERVDRKLEVRPKSAWSVLAGLRRTVARRRRNISRGVAIAWMHGLPEQPPCTRAWEISSPTTSDDVPNIGKKAVCASRNIYPRGALRSEQNGSRREAPATRHPRHQSLSTVGARRRESMRWSMVVMSHVGNPGVATQRDPRADGALPAEPSVRSATSPTPITQRFYPAFDAIGQAHSIRTF